MQETWVISLDLEDPLEKEMAIHSSILAWETPGTEEPSGLSSMGSQRVELNLATKKQEHHGQMRFPLRRANSKGHSHCFS